MRRVIPGFLACIALAAGSACVHNHIHGSGGSAPVARVPGPPPHAPAHGYRAKHKGADLVFDVQLGVYTVVGRDGHFFFEDHFYRHVKSGWEISLRLDGGWAPAVSAKLPPGLAKKYGKAQWKAKPGHVPAKHGR